MIYNKFQREILDLGTVVSQMSEVQEEVEYAGHILANCVAYGGTVYVIGNGGSAADANHFTGEVLGRFKKERKGLGAVSLTADNATITAIANDYGFEWVFQRQLEGLFDPFKDILVTMSTSGNSPNILRAIEYVRELKGSCINLLGKDGGKINRNDTGVNIIIPSHDTARIQEMHKFIIHYFSGVIEDKYMEIKKK